MGHSDRLDEHTLRALAGVMPPVDLTHLTGEELIELIEHTNHTRATLAIVLGRLVAEAQRQGWSYRQITERTGIPRTTLHRWAKDVTDVDKPADGTTGQEA